MWCFKVNIVCAINTVALGKRVNSVLCKYRLNQCFEKCLETMQYWILVIGYNKRVIIRHFSVLNFISPFKTPYLVHCDRSEKFEGVYNTLNMKVVWLQKILFDSKEFNNYPSNMMDH
jgi:hypothetical protein